jgi:phosphoribosylcarboxyaminoimidazole (NCAIR) mutase
MLALENVELAEKLAEFRRKQTAKVTQAVLPELD